MLPPLLAVALTTAASLPPPAQGNGLSRPHDPVVMTGADLPSFAGAGIDRLVAFRWQVAAGGTGGSWVQIPLQLDERLEVAFQIVYGSGWTLGSAATTIGYADPNTYTGSDFDPSFDADDELVVMARDAGSRAQGSPVRPQDQPNGTLAGSGVEVELTDPLQGGSAWVYLFRSDGSLDPAAGQDLVRYRFAPLSGNYLETYNVTDGPNPEDSVVATPFYLVHFSDRWIRDEIRVHAGGASGVDLLDRHKYMFGPDACGRTEESFSEGEGAFFANIDGPLRAIRSYMGANSGPMTQRDHFFYAQREDVATTMRVHSLHIGGMDVFDYEPAAAGMFYANDRNQAGVLVDGLPETLETGPVRWELLTGFQGSLLMSMRDETDIPDFSPDSYFSDDQDPQQHQCTGDTFEFGLSGQWVRHPLPNTDPRLSPVFCLKKLRTIYYEGPNQDTALAALRAEQARTPVQFSARAFVLAPSVLASCSAKPNSLGCRPSIHGQGQPSAEADRGFVVSAENVRNNENGLLFYSVGGRAAPPFQGGMLCVSSPVRRTPGCRSGGNPAPAKDCSGRFSIDLNAFAHGAAGGSPLPELSVTGTVVACQWWGRDPGFPPPDNATLTAGLEYVIGCADACPDDPDKVAPGICGCGVPDTDRDGDGVADCRDNCAEVPNPDQADCDANGIGDLCEIAQGAADCNLNSVPDACDIRNGTSLDRNGNGVPDECEI